MIGTAIVNILDMLDCGKDDILKIICDEFECPLNKDVEKFLKYKAIEFSKQRIAATYLVFKQYKQNDVVVGYFSIAQKYFHVSYKERNRKISSKLRAKINTFGHYEPELQKYVVPAMLIGQLGKNYANGYDELISGDELLKIACEKVHEVQRISSGRLTYLECEDVERLKEFYIRNGFSPFAMRELEADEADMKSEKLVQLMKIV